MISTRKQIEKLTAQLERVTAQRKKYQEKERSVKAKLRAAQTKLRNERLIKKGRAIEELQGAHAAEMAPEATLDWLEQEFGAKVADETAELRKE